MTVKAVVTWWWKPKPGYRSTYSAETVNRLFRMIRRHYSAFTPICVTDTPQGLDRDIVVIPDWHDFADVPSPHGGNNPSCYRRLRMFHPEIAAHFSDRFVSIDQDMVITGDLSPVWDRPEDIVLYGDTNPQPGSHYNGSMILLKAGARPRVWTDFNPTLSPRQAKSNQSFGSDQGWISYCLGHGEARWTQKDGVYSFRNHLHPKMHHLPTDARVTIWHGHIDPWSDYAKQIAWVRRHYYGEGLEQERVSA